jgi:hypothetical protein
MFDVVVLPPPGEAYARFGTRLKIALQICIWRACIRCKHGIIGGAGMLTNAHAPVTDSER